MKVIIILATIALAHGAELQRAYLPPSHSRASGGSSSFLQTPVQGPAFTRNAYNPNFAGQPQAGGDFARTEGQSNFAQAQYNNVNQLHNFGTFESRPERAQAARERNAAILRSDSSNDGDTFSYVYETENGIYAEESGVATNGVEAQGGYSYTGDDGQLFSVRYTADQNGFVPQGDHLPTPPPIPEEILKALEQNARDEAAGIYDDGSYNEGKYSDNGNQYNNYQNQDRYNSFGGDDTDSVVVNSASSRSSSRGPADAAFSGQHSGVTGAISARGPINSAYLPPFSQRGPASNGGRQNFDTRTGYRY